MQLRFIMWVCNFDFQKTPWYISCKNCISAFNNVTYIQNFGLYTTSNLALNVTTKGTHRIHYVVLIITYKKEEFMMIMKMITRSGSQMMIMFHHLQSFKVPKKILYSPAKQELLTIQTVISDNTYI